jgi:hypothetical protein
VAALTTEGSEPSCAVGVDNSHPRASATAFAEINAATSPPKSTGNSWSTEDGSKVVPRSWPKFFFPESFTTP